MKVNIWCMYVRTAQHQTGSDLAVYEFRCKEQSVFIYDLTSVPCGFCFPDDEEGMECVQAYTHVNTARTQLEQRQIRFELDLQDDLMTKLPVLQARLKGLANAARNASCPESLELWEGRVNEIEFRADTTGKRAALAFAKSFYSGKSGFFTAHF